MSEMPRLTMRYEYEFGSQGPVKVLGMRVISPDVCRSKNKEQLKEKSHNKVIKLRFLTCYHHSRLYQSFSLGFFFSFVRRSVQTKLFFTKYTVS